MSRLARDEGERARHMSKLAMIPDVYRGHNELVNGPSMPSRWPDTDLRVPRSSTIGQSTRLH